MKYFCDGSYPINLTFIYYFFGQNKSYNEKSCFYYSFLSIEELSVSEYSTSDSSF